MYAAGGCARGIVLHIARRGVDTSERLGRYRWKIEGTLAWLTGCRRLTVRYGEHFAGFLQLAAALTCWKKLAKSDPLSRRRSVCAAHCGVWLSRR